MSQWDDYQQFQRLVDSLRVGDTLLREHREIQNRVGDMIRNAVPSQDLVRQLSETGLRPGEGFAQEYRQIQEQIAAVVRETGSTRELVRQLSETIVRPGENIVREYQNLMAELARQAIPAQELINQFSDLRNAVAHPPDLSWTIEALAAAVKPLPGIEALFARQLEEALSFTSAINIGLGEARFLAELNLEEEDESQAPAGDIADQAEGHLIEVVPAETLQDLKRVNFAPLRVLDQVLREPTALRAIGARDFEGFVAALVEQLGFEDVVLTPRSGDHGRDVLATKRIHGISILCAFECKRYAPNRPIGPDIARALLGTITHGPTRASKGILVTTSFFTPAARRFILTEPSLDGRDFDGIVEWLKEYAVARLRRDA